MIRFYLALIFLLPYLTNQAQQPAADSTATALAEVAIKAFESRQSLLRTAAAVNVVRPEMLAQFANTNLLPAFSQQAGIRMEERSPGSYRLSIRGSSLRSPFGVRNVKIYWNGIPFSDANGITYFNTLDMNALQQAELIKGPAASLYGASLGGVILLDAKAATQQQNRWGKLEAQTVFGSYGLSNQGITYSFATKKLNTQTTLGRSHTAGYRNHSRFDRQSVFHRSSWFYSPKGTLHVSANHAVVDYQTPGGLTSKQIEENRRQARPATKFLPSAVEQQAGIAHRFTQLGLSNEWQISPRLTHQVAIFGAFTQLANPFITNYEERHENTLGSRTQFTWQQPIGEATMRLHVGGELNHTQGNYQVFANNKGEKGNEMSDISTKTRNDFLFLQADLPLGRQWWLTAGTSYQLFRLTTNATTAAAIQPERSWMPRVALGWQPSASQTIYLSSSSGYSPPTAQELVANYSQQRFNTQSERGQNWEIGWRANWWQKRVQTDVSVFNMMVRNGLVRQLTSTEQEVFINASKLLYRGAEANVWASLYQSATTRWQLNAALAYHPFTYQTYQLGALSFNGNALPSVPKRTFSLGSNIRWKSLYASLLSNWLDKIPLDDANTVYSERATLVYGRLGVRNSFQSISYDIFIGGENLLNQAISLGNDYNAFGGRYFNPAAPRSGYMGLKLTF